MLRNKCSKAVLISSAQTLVHRHVLILQITELMRELHNHSSLFLL